MTKGTQEGQTESTRVRFNVPLDRL